MNLNMIPSTLNSHRSAKCHIKQPDELTKWSSMPLDRILEGKVSKGKQERENWLHTSYSSPKNTRISPWTREKMKEKLSPFEMTVRFFGLVEVVNTSIGSSPVSLIIQPAWPCGFSSLSSTSNVFFERGVTFRVILQPRHRKMTAFLVALMGTGC